MKFSVIKGLRRSQDNAINAKRLAMIQNGRVEKMPTIVTGNYTVPVPIGSRTTRPVIFPVPQDCRVRAERNFA